MAVTFIIGGARSGKSRLAEDLARATGLARVYLATAGAVADDAEFAARISAHRARRGADWQTHEEPIDIAPLIEQSAATQVVLVDCLTLWLSNLLAAGRDPEAEAGRLLGALAKTPASLIVVSGEVGAGIVPANALGRAFRDAQGLLNQRVAATAGDVITVLAGLPLYLKQNGKILHG